MELRVLGPVEASVDERPVAIGAGKPRALLAMLGLNAGSAVSAERLIDGLWGEEPPATAPKMVQVYVSQLRKSLASGGDGAEILTRGRGYELRLGDGDVDARRFERLVVAGAPREALELWRGPPLDDVATEPFAALEIRRLEELHMAAAEQAIEQDLAAGRHADVVPELAALIAQEPLRERLHGQRMLALYRSGRQAEALEAYRQARSALVEAIGVEPGPELRELHDAILRQDASLGLPEVLPAALDGARDPARRLDESAVRAATERARQRAAEDDLAGDVVALQAAREGALRRADGIVTCPFKGLASFDVDDAAFFFGRERLVAEMVARLPGAPLLGIVGPSGSGKSSALRAGLLPALADGVLPGSDRWAVALLRPGEHPLAALETAVRDAPLRSRLVIAIDQFEELFTACHDEAERTRFADALVTAVRSSRRHALALIALRADFYGRCASYPELWRMLGANHVPVAPMRRDELRRAIDSPARRAGLEVDPALVDALIADVEGEPGALPLLSTALLELWQQRDGRRMTLAAYEHAGGVDGAVARLAERAYERLAPERRPVARAVLLRLSGVGEGDAAVRRRVPLAELEDAAEVLDALADDRLVTIREGEAEVAHEALLREWPRLRGWLEEDAHGRRLHHHLGLAARDWDARGRDPGELYRGARLAAALDWAVAHDPELDATERRFLDESRTANERSQRRLRAVLAGVAGLLVIAVVAGVVALGQSGTAREQAKVADAQRLGSRALAENDLDRALLLARQGVALDDRPQTRGSLLAALMKSPAAIGVLRSAGESFSALALSPGGRTLAAGDPAGNLFLFDTRTRRRVRAPDPQPGEWRITDLAYSPDGRQLAVAHDALYGNQVTLMDTRTLHMGRRLSTYDEGRRVTDVRFAGVAGAVDVATVALDPRSDPHSTVERFELRTGRQLIGPVRLGPHEGSPLLGSSDGRHVLTVSRDELTLRDARTLRPVDRIEIGPPRGGRNERAIAIAPDDRTVAVGEGDGTLRFVDLRSGAVRTASGRHGGAVTAARFTPDGSALVTTGDDGDAILWDVRAGAAAETLSGHANGIAALELTRDGRTLYTAGLDGAILVWDLAGTARLGRPIQAGGRNQTVAALSSDGRRLAIGQEDGAIGVVDLDRPERRRAFPVIARGEALTGVRFVPGSRLLVVMGSEMSATLVDTDTGRIVRTLAAGNEEDTSSATTPGMSADGRLLATIGSPNGVDELDVVLWTLPSGRPVGTPLRLDREIQDAQISPDGRLLAVVLKDPVGDGGAVEAWDVRQRRRVRSVRLARLPVFARFSPDGRLLAVGNRAGESRLYETATFEPVTRVLRGDAGTILGAAIAPDDRTLATGSETGAVQLWDIPSGQALGAPLPGVPSSGVTPAFTPDGRRLVAAYATGRAYVWDIRRRSLLEHACRVAGRRLTRAEWEEFLPGRDYAPAC